MGTRHNPRPPTVLSRIYWTVIIPKITYGLVLMVLQKFLVVPVLSGPCLDGPFPVYSHIAQAIVLHVSLPTLGWWSVSSWLSYKCLVMMWQILLLPMDSLHNLGDITRSPNTTSNYRSPMGIMYDNDNVDLIKC